MALSCFISGLIPSIRREVQVMQPATISQAVAYAKLHEEKQNDARKAFRPVAGASSSSLQHSASAPLSTTPLLQILYKVCKNLRKPVGSGQSILLDNKLGSPMEAIRT